MTFYLSLDGVDDTIFVPSSTFDEIILDVKYPQTEGIQMYWDFLVNGTSVQFYTTGTVDYHYGAAKVVGIYVNGVKGTNNTKFIPVATRHILRFKATESTTVVSTLFSRSDGNSPARADVYDIKYYNVGSLVAHYDMTTGTLQDQSGNGSHALLTGGTWVDDGAGDTGTPGTVSYATKQVINRVASTPYATKQVINRTGSTAYATKQAINQTGSAAFATQQNIQVVGAAGSLKYATKQVVYQSASAQVATKQSIYRVSFSEWATTQAILDFVEFIASISLTGDISPTVSLGASKESVTLAAERVLSSSLQGSVNPPSVALVGEI